MKTQLFFLIAALAAGLGCQETHEAKPIQSTTPEALAPTPSGIRGTVVETMNSGGYTYVKLDTGGSAAVWAAGPTTVVKVGDPVSFAGGMAMNNFESKTLNRVFEKIYFVNALQVAGQPGASAAPTAQPAPRAPAPAEKIEVEKVQGGMTVAEVFQGSADLVGKKVKLRAKVVKYNGGIMGRNWLHLQDGTGATGTNDLTVTTDATATVGDVVVVEGVVATDKDFGAGYSYPVIVEDATIIE